MSDAAPISIRGITKRYGDICAVNNLNLEVEEGEILGFLGLNGAGKSTAIRILLDLLRPDSGHASLFGHDCQAQGLHARKNIGYLPAEMGIYPDLTGREVLIFSQASVELAIVNRAVASFRTYWNSPIATCAAAFGSTAPE